MNFQKLVRDFFTFNRNERRGIVVLLVLIFVLAIINKFVFYFEKPAKIDNDLLNSESRSLGEYSDSVNQIQPVSSKLLFYFNPNTIDSLALDSLDIPSQLKHNMLKFRNKGGEFKSVDDFRKLYGVTDGLFARVSPFLLLKSETVEKRAHSSGFERFVFDPNLATDDDFARLGFSSKQISSIRKYMDKSGAFRSKEDFFKIKVITENQKEALAQWIVIGVSEKAKVLEVRSSVLSIEINTADTTLLKRLPGIGSVFARRIVKYRDLLGGYYSINQLNEVYGLDEQTIRQITPMITVDAKRIRKVDLNFADFAELSRHPYIQKGLARKIVNFRSKNGSIGNFSILRDSLVLTPEEFAKIKPYF